MSYRYKQNYLPEAVAHNQKTLNNFRSLLAILGGIISGMLGFSGFAGFLIFLPFSLAGSFVYVARLGDRVYEFYPSLITIFKTWLSGFMVYLLTWIVFYNIIYILS